MNHPTPDPALFKRPLPALFLERLEAHFGDRFSTSQAVREHHGRDESAYDPMLPDAVVFAESTDDVVAAVKLCDAFDVPLIAYGSGSSLEGHLLAVAGGVTIDLSRMNRMVSIDAQDLSATVEAGVTRKQSTWP